MSDQQRSCWSPVDSTLGPDMARETDAALAPLAAEALRIKWVTIGGAGLLCVLALALALASNATRWSTAGGVSVVVASIAFAIGLQKRKIWDGSPGWLRLYSRPITAPVLPAGSQEILADLRAGTRRARYRRGGANEAVELPYLMLRGPFGPLILSTDPHVQGLALWNWFAGDRLGIQIEEAPPGALQPAEPAETSAAQTGDILEPVEAAHTPKKRPTKHMQFNAVILLAKVDLDAKLQQTYPRAFEANFQPEDRYHRERIIVRTFQLANELLRRHQYTTVTDLRVDVVRKLREEDIFNYGLGRDGESASSSWMEKALSRAGYPSIEKEFRLAMERDEAE